MNKIIKTILVIAGIFFLAYGGYMIITPEASVDVGIAEFESQDNTNGYITLGIGIILLVISLIPFKKNS